MEPYDTTSMLDHFRLLDDPRHNHWNILHHIEDLLVMAFSAVLGGADGWDEIALFVKSKADWFTEHLQLQNGVPSADTFRRVISVIKPEGFAECLSCWLTTRLGGDQVAIDGKALRGSYDKEDPKAILHLISAWASGHRLILAQMKVDEHSNEITAIPKLLALLDLSGALVSLDAMGCQRAIAAQLVAQKADYLLALRDNQPTLRAEVEAYFSQGQARAFAGMDVTRCEKEEIGHGRQEVRRCVASQEVEKLGQGPKWAGLRTIARVEYCRDVYTSEVFSEWYFLSSRVMTASEVLQAVRQHWQIENEVHWVLDVSFSEDASRIRRDAGAENFAILRRLALNVLRQDETSRKTSIKGRRRKAGWSNDYLAQLLRL